MSKPHEYPGRTVQDSEDQWRRDYGHRNPGSGSAPRVVPSPPDYSRESAIERELRDNDYPEDPGYAQDDRFLLDFGALDAREILVPAQDYRGPSSSARRHFQPQPRQHLEHFGSRMRNEATHPSGVQAASFYGRGPKGYVRSDERIREDVCRRLTDHDELDASELEVTVRDREVTLTGRVQTRRMKHLSEDIAVAVPGVADVHNRITVRKGLLGEVVDRVFYRAAPTREAQSGTRAVPQHLNFAGSQRAPGLRD